MKVLIVAPYITHRSHPAFLRNQTGLGYMIHDIASSIGKIEEVDVFCFFCFTPSMEIDNFSVIGRSWRTFLRALRFRNLMDAFTYIYKFRPNFRKLPRTLYTFMATGQLEQIVKNYDIVHIQQCTSLLFSTIKACQRSHVPFLTTLHGLISFEKEVYAESAAKRLERFLIKESAEKRWPMTYISTGIRRTAEDYIGKSDIKSFYVVTNGTPIDGMDAPNNDAENLRAKHNIPLNDFVFVCVGNLSPRKNQVQVARAYALLPSEVQKHTWIVFIGREVDYGALRTMIADKELASRLLILGSMPSQNVNAYYAIANATVLASISEGFGLSIIEGFAAGLPNLTFSNLSAVPDLYDAKAMISVHERTDEALAQGMMDMMNTSWDKSYIKHHAHKFSLENMAAQYINVYHQICK